MRTHVLQLVSPQFCGPLQDSEAAERIEEVVERVGAFFERVTINTRAELHSYVRALIADRTPEPRLVILAGHGMQKTRAGTTEPQNLLYVRDTRDDDVFETAVDLDAIVRELQGAADSCFVLVVDACEVDVRGIRSADSAGRVAVLLASPGLPAESGAMGGVLTRELAESLDSAFETGRTLRWALDESQNRVSRATRQRQRSRLEEFGGAPFLDTELPVVSPANVTAPGLLSSVLTASLDRALTAESTNALSAVADRTPDPLGTELTLVLLADRLLATRDPATAEELERRVRAADDHGRIDPRAVARGKHVLGWLATITNADKRRRSHAVASLEDALHLLKSSTTPCLELEAQALDTLGTLHASSEQWREALSAYERSLGLKNDLGDLVGIEMTRQNIGWLLLGWGRFEEGEREFRSGVETCLDRLESPPPRASKLLEPTLTSLAFHLEGYLTALHIRGARCRDFIDELLRRTEPFWPFVETMKRWGSIAPFELVDQLRAAGRGAVTQTTGHVGDNGSLRIWSQLAQFVREGDACLEDLRTSLIETSRAGLKPRIGALSAASYLYYREQSPAAPKLLKDVVDSLRTVDRSIDPPQAWPWSVGAPKTRIDTSGWPEHLFLAAQTRESSSESVVAHPSVTEQYLQLLAWYCALLLALDGGTSATQLAEFVMKERKYGQFMLTLRGAFMLAVSCAEVGKKRADWGKALAVAWEGLTPLRSAGYEQLDDLFAERNDTSHRKPLREAQLREILAKHGDLIRETTELLRPADTMTVLADGPYITKGRELRAAILVTSAGRKRLDCGPFLAVRGDDTGTLWVPHKLDRGALGEEGASQGTYVAYPLESGGGAFEEFSVNVTWRADRSS